MKRIRWGVVARLTIFGIFTVYFGANLTGAWVFVGRLIHPGCPAAVPLGENFSIPEKIQLQTQDGVSVPAWYYPSQNGAAIITLGGLGGALGTALPPAGPLIEAGFGVLQIGSRACATPVRPVTLGGSEIQEAAAGLAFLLSRTDIDSGHIGIFGFSMGGVGAIRTAARHPEIAAVVAEGGYFNLGDDFVEFEVAEPLYRKVFLVTVAGVFWLRTGNNPWQISPLDEIGTLSPRPVLLIYGEHEAVSGRAQLQFDAAGEPKELWVVPGGDHGKNHLVVPDEYTHRIVTFFKTALVSE